VKNKFTIVLLCSNVSFLLLQIRFLTFTDYRLTPFRHLYKVDAVATNSDQIKSASYKEWNWRESVAMYSVSTGHYL